MAKKIILGIHGLGGHSGWFKNLENDLEKQGVDFYAFDLPGFGTNHNLVSQSPYIKGHVDSYKEWISFAQAEYCKLREKNPEAEIIVLGHSLGALIAANMTEIDQGTKLILSVPGFKGSPNTFNQSFFWSTLRKVVIDKFILQKNVYVKLPSSQKKSTPADADPLRILEVTQTMLLEILKLRAASKNRMSQISSPIFMIQIAEDKVVDNPTQDEYYELINSDDKKFKAYYGADHDWIWSEAVCAAVTEDVVNWLSQ